MFSLARHSEDTMHHKYGEKKTHNRRSILKLKKSTLKVLLIVLSALAAASSLFLYITHTAPTVEERTVPVLTYTETGKFSCVARLKPNIIYNRTTLKPEEGTLYMQITENFSITFTYHFTISRPANITIAYDLNRTITSPAGWTKTYITALEGTPLSFAGNTARFTLNMTLDPTIYEEIVKAINDEIGTTSKDYTITIKPRIQTVAETGGQLVEETFEPALEVKAEYGTQMGAIYSMEGLEHKDERTITRKETIQRPVVVERRYASYAIAITTFTALTYTIWQFARTREYIAAKTVEEEVKPFREIIVDITEKPIRERGLTTVRMKTLKDLGKISEEIVKPILHEESIVEKEGSETRRHIFYVLDGDVRYEFTLEEMVEERKMEREASRAKIGAKAETR